MLKGRLVSLKRMTRTECHQLYKKYVSDPQMTEVVFVYDEGKIDEYYDLKTGDRGRNLFSIIYQDEIVGEIQLKRIDRQLKQATMSVLLANDSYKNKGLGTEAEKLLIGYAFDELGLIRILADTTERNNRSKRVLEKLGFKYLYSENQMDYFELTR